MTDSTAPQETPREPQGPPRVPKLDLPAALKLLEQLDKDTQHYIDEVDHRHAMAFANRAHLRYALGFSPTAVLDDFWMSARCLTGDAALHLARHTDEQLLTRRILPVELGLLSGHVELSKRLAASYALPTLAISAGVGGPRLRQEGRVLSPGLLGEPIGHVQHLLGLAAAVYAGCLGSAVRGYADEVQLTLRLLAEAKFRGKLDDGARQIMVRYTGLCEVLQELVQPSGRNLPAILADQIERYTTRLARTAGDAFFAPTKPLRYMDTSVLALMALMRLVDRPMESFPPHPEVTPAAVPYMDFVTVMFEAERELPPPPGDGTEKAVEAMEAMGAQRVDGPKEP